MLGAEIFVLSEMIDEEFAIFHHKKQVTDMCAPLHLMKLIKCLFDELLRVSRTSEKCMMIDVESAQDAYQVREIDNICFVWSDFNLGVRFIEGQQAPELA